MSKYVRKNIAQMHSYTPGEQPKGQRIIKLNTNENPYPPSPDVAKALSSVSDKLRLYPPPKAEPLAEAASKIYNTPKENFIFGNGSDDILTIIIRTFVNEGETIAWLDPSYSLYPVLANIQNAKTLSIPLNKDFTLPEDITKKLANTKLFFITRQNAPTGMSYPKEKIAEICKSLDGIVVVDEAYADFAEDNCMDMIQDFDNLIVIRTFSKSYSLAGLRIGLALANKSIIESMMKVKDSYNVNILSQIAAIAALEDQEYFKEVINKVKITREKTSEELKKLGFKVLPSETNFLFVKPPISAKKFQHQLKEEGFLIRYFPAEITKDYVRITIGTDDEMSAFLKTTSEII